jgi:hypothetical protein
MSSQPRPTRGVFGWVALSSGFSLLANTLPLVSGPRMSDSVLVFRITLSIISLVLMVFSAIRFFRGDTGEVPPRRLEEIDTRYGTEQSYEDPGWLLSFRRLHPGPRGGAVLDGLVLLRMVFLALLLAALMILFILGFIIPATGTPDLGLSVAVVIAGLAGVAGAAWTRARELDVRNASHLALTYRTSFFVGFALVEAPLVMSFVLCFITQRSWPYLMALPLYLLGMALIAPSRHDLERKQSGSIKEDRTCRWHAR